MRRDFTSVDEAIQCRASRVANLKRKVDVKLMMLSASVDDKKDSYLSLAENGRQEDSAVRGYSLAKM